MITKFKEYLDRINSLRNDIEDFNIGINNKTEELYDIIGRVQLPLITYLDTEFKKHFKFDYDKYQKKFLVDDDFALIYRIYDPTFDPTFDRKYHDNNENYILKSFGIYKHQSGKWVYSRAMYLTKKELHSDTVENDLREFIDDSVRIIKEKSVKRKADKEKRLMKKNVDKYNL